MAGGDLGHSGGGCDCAHFGVRGGAGGARAPQRRERVCVGPPAREQSSAAARIAGAGAGEGGKKNAARAGERCGRRFGRRAAAGRAQARGEGLGQPGAPQAASTVCSAG